MLNAKQNMREAVRGGAPDRFVNQYEAVYLMPHPFAARNPRAQKGELDVVNAWGVTNSYPAHTPGQFPVHTPDKIVIKDITRWRDYVKASSLVFSDEEWDAAKAVYDAVDGEKVYKAVFVAPGLFEQTHHLGEICNALVNYASNPKETRELIDYLTQWELELAEGVCSRLSPDAVFHHDDWGTEDSTFLRPEMFAEFFVEPYKKIYGYYHDHGVELVIHHSDSYAATLVPYMIEMGIDVWQGCMESNDIPSLVKKYGDKIAFMGGIDNKAVDFEGWSQKDCDIAVRKACESAGTRSFIPCITQGGPGSVFPGAYMGLSAALDRYNSETFGVTPGGDERAPLQLFTDGAIKYE